MRHANDDTLRILMAGPLPPPLGGTTVSFRSLVDALEARGDVAVRVVSTGGVRGRGLAGVAALFRLAGRTAKELCSADVVALFASTTGLHVLAPLFAQLARRSAVPLIIRKFGGSDFSNYAPPRRASILWGLRGAALYLAQTKALVERAKAAGLAHTEWYPNSRPMPELPDKDESGERTCRRFVFLGQMRGVKGVRELAEAAELLPAGVTIDVYGTLGFDVTEAELSAAARLDYRGTANPDEVHDILSSYDALVLPTYHEGEGYPGVVLEAYGAGLPVVSTRWRAIPELVDDGATGLLVEPRDAGSLRDAMLSLVDNAELYVRLREGVRERRGEFSDEIWSQRFVEHCPGVVLATGIPGALEPPEGVRSRDADCRHGREE